MTPSLDLIMAEARSVVSAKPHPTVSTRSSDAWMTLANRAKTTLLDVLTDRSNDEDSLLKARGLLLELDPSLIDYDLQYAEREGTLSHTSETSVPSVSAAPSGGGPPSVVGPAVDRKPPRQSLRLPANPSSVDARAAETFDPACDHCRDGLGLKTCPRAKGIPHKRCVACVRAARQCSFKNLRKSHKLPDVLPTKDTLVGVSESVPPNAQGSKRKATEMADIEPLLKRMAAKLREAQDIHESIMEQLS
ncbi:hypothetical protein OF83DRAFT_1171730 [Amylostereum chailletii]|nr:hypothetical protein OF83DRAFT_1171730 [Amylostereum chailletii]